MLETLSASLEEKIMKFSVGKNSEILSLAIPNWKVHGITDNHIGVKLTGNKWIKDYVNHGLSIIGACLLNKKSYFSKKLTIEAAELDFSENFGITLDETRGIMYGFLGIRKEILAQNLNNKFYDFAESIRNVVFCSK